MNNKDKRGLLDISVITVKVVLCIMICSIAFVFIYYGMIKKGVILENEPLRMVDEWSTEDKENTFTVISILPNDIGENEYLFFETRKDVEVFVNGELRKDFIEDRDLNFPGGSVKRFYMMVPLKEADSEKEIKLVYYSILKEDHRVPTAFVSTRDGAMRYLFDRYGLSFILAMIVLIISFLVFVVSVILRLWYKLKIDMMYGALGIFIIAAYLITDSYLCPFFFKVYYVYGILNYLICLTIPFAPSIYLNSVQGGRFKKSLSVIMIVACINAVLWSGLHFTGILSFNNIITIENIILSLMAVSAIVLLIYDAVKGNVSGYKYTLIGFFGFLICCIIQLSILLLYTYTNSIPLVAGLSFLLVFVVIQQIEDLRNINTEKQHAIDISEAKTKFLASMSHEIRTPINAILGMNEMILRENNDRVIDEYSRSIKSSGKMLLMLVNDVLDFSKIESGKLEINYSRFFMSDLLYDIISLVKERADEKKLEIETYIKDGVPNEMVSDEFRIRQILVNLMNNAVKYTEKGSVTLKMGGSYRDDKTFELSFSVKDTGRGIRKEDQPALFDAFTRVDIKSNANIEGTGLGLAIVKSIIDSMNGTIEVNSEYGSGSEFTVTLPVRFLSSEPLRSDFMRNRTEHVDVSDDEILTAPDAKVLAVDDNQSNLTIVKLFLKRSEIKPDLCSTGTEAVEMCRKNRYDLILLDHMMPSPDGIETLHIIRNDEASLNKETKAVVLTANALAGSRQMYLDEGFDDYLAKPLDSKVLEQTVLNMIPKEKVKCVSPEVKANKEKPEKESLSVKKRLTSIEGLDYESALAYCGNSEEFLRKIVSNVASGCKERSAKLKNIVAENDIRAYEIEAHTIKSTMATIGMKAFSETAKKHEFAAKDNDIGFIMDNAEDFINEYNEICKKLEAAVR